MARYHDPVGVGKRADANSQDGFHEGDLATELRRVPLIDGNDDVLYFAVLKILERDLTRGPVRRLRVLLRPLAALLAVAASQQPQEFVARTLAQLAFQERVSEPLRFVARGLDDERVALYVQELPALVHRRFPLRHGAANVVRARKPGRNNPSLLPVRIRVVRVATGIVRPFLVRVIVVVCVPAPKQSIVLVHHNMKRNTLRQTTVSAHNLNSAICVLFQRYGF